MFDPVAVLQQLIRIDTTNPPGNERPAVAVIRQLLDDSGIATEELAKDPARPNLIARICGSGDAPPLLLQGHVDVVSTAGQRWDHDPFGGEIIDGFLWGRGALDMKGAVVMMVHALVALAEISGSIRYNFGNFYNGTRSTVIGGLRYAPKPQRKQKQT